MRLRLLLLAAVVIFAVISCQKKAEQKPANQIAAHVRAVVAEDVVQTSSYTYLNAKEGSQTYWMAVSKGEVEKGDTLYFSAALEMKNFESKELNKTFD